MKWRARWAGDASARPRELVASKVSIAKGADALEAQLLRPKASLGAVICAHARATSAIEEDERALAGTLADAGFATLLVGLHTAQEADRAETPDVPRLAERLLVATRWLYTSGASARLPLGYLGVENAAAAALVASAMEPRQVMALVGRSTRPDRAGMSVLLTTAPKLFLVDDDAPEQVAACQRVPHAKMEVVPRKASVAALCTAWFTRHLAPPAALLPGGGAWAAT